MAISREMFKQAAHDGDIEAIKAYLASVAELDEEIILTTIAVATKNLDFLKFLLQDNRFDITAATSNGQTILHGAAVMGTIEVLRFLLQHPKVKEADLINSVDAEGSTVLHAASLRLDDDDEFLTCLLLDRTLSDQLILAADKNQDTALHLAAGLKNEKILQLLLRDPRIIEARTINRVNTNGESVLQIAAYAKSYLHYKWERSLEVEAKTLKCTELVLKDPYLATDVINSANSKGESLLYTTAVGNDAPCLKLLLANENLTEQTINARTLCGETALHPAAMHTFTECLRALLEEPRFQNPSISVASEGGFTALHIAAQYNNDKCIRLLIEDRRMDVNVPNQYGDTALHTLTGNSSLDKNCLNEMLKSDRIDINARNQEGNTALHLLLTHKPEYVGILLADPRIDFTVQNNAGQTAEQVAKGAYPRLIRELEKSQIRKIEKTIREKTKALALIRIKQQDKFFDTMPNELFHQTVKDAVVKETRCSSELVEKIFLRLVEQSVKQPKNDPKSDVSKGPDIGGGAGAKS